MVALVLARSSGCSRSRNSTGLQGAKVITTRRTVTHHQQQQHRTVNGWLGSRLSIWNEGRHEAVGNGAVGEYRIVTSRSQSQQQKCRLVITGQYHYRRSATTRNIVSSGHHQGHTNSRRRLSVCCNRIVHMNTTHRTMKQQGQHIITGQNVT